MNCLLGCFLSTLRNNGYVENYCPDRDETKIADSQKVLKNINKGEKVHRQKTGLSIEAFIVYLLKGRMHRELMPRSIVQPSSNSDKGNHQNFKFHSQKH